MGQVRLLAWRIHWKRFELVHPFVVSRSENYQVDRMVLAKLMESSDLAPACTYQLGGGRAQQRNNGVCQHFCP